MLTVLVEFLILQRAMVTIFHILSPYQINLLITDLPTLFFWKNRIFFFIIACAHTWRGDVAVDIEWRTCTTCHRSCRRWRFY